MNTTTHSLCAPPPEQKSGDTEEL